MTYSDTFFSRTSTAAPLACLEAREDSLVTPEIAFSFEEGANILSSLDRKPRVLEKLRRAYLSM